VDNIRKQLNKSIADSLKYVKNATIDTLANEIQEHINNLPDSGPIGVYCDDFLESYPEVDYELHLLIMNHRMKTKYID
tara:strand:- start:572 stop:805 length:234 start_codon:yes stop_codon:yes gene_type:complete